MIDASLRRVANALDEIRDGLPKSDEERRMMARQLVEMGRQMESEHQGSLSSVGGRQQRPGWIAWSQIRGARSSGKTSHRTLSEPQTSEGSAAQSSASTVDSRRSGSTSGDHLRHSLAQAREEIMEEIRTANTPEDAVVQQFRVLELALDDIREAVTSVDRSCTYLLFTLLSQALRSYPGSLRLSTRPPCLLQDLSHPCETSLST